MRSPLIVTRMLFSYKKTNFCAFVKMCGVNIHDVNMSPSTTKRLTNNSSSFSAFTNPCSNIYIIYLHYVHNSKTIIKGFSRNCTSFSLLHSCLLSPLLSSRHGGLSQSLFAAQTSYVARSGTRLRERSAICTSFSLHLRPLSPRIASRMLLSSENLIFVRMWFTTSA